jgi:hypothetical protein
MLRFLLKLKISRRINATCPTHPRYNPETSGQRGIRGGCPVCNDIFTLFRSRMTLEAAARDFEDKAQSWIPVRKTEPTP